MGASISGADQRGNGCLELGEYLCGSGSGDHALWVGDVGNDTAHREGLGRIPSQGVPHAHGETSSDRKGWWMGVSLS